MRTYKFMFGKQQDQKDIERLAENLFVDGTYAGVVKRQAFDLEAAVREYLTGSQGESVRKFALIAQFNSTTVGFAMCSALVEHGVVKMDYIYINPDDRGAGIASKFRKMMEETGTTLGCSLSSVGISNNSNAIFKSLTSDGYVPYETVYMKRINNV